MKEELDVLNQFFPNDEVSNREFLENKDVDQESPEFLTKGGADFPYAEGPLGKQALPAPKGKQQIFPMYPGTVFDVNVPETGLRGGDSGFFSQSEDEKAIVKNIAELKQQQQNKYSTRVMKAMEEAGFGDSKIDISDFTKSSFLGISPTEETETSKILNSYPGSQQAQLAFVDDDDDYEQWLKTTVGTDNYRIFYDKKSGLLEPRAYVSIRKPDGEFTPFSSVTKTLTDGLLQFGSTIAYEIPAYAANVAQATAVAAPFSAIPFVGIPLASTVFVYSLYAGGKGKERVREFVKEQMGINEDADKNLYENTVRFLENALDVADPRKVGQDTFREELSGVADAIPGGAYFVRAFKNAADKAKVKFINMAGDAKAKYFPSVSGAMSMAKASQPGGRLDIGVPLDKLIITNLTPNKVLERFQNISSQVSVLIPTRMKQQMNSAVNYISKYRDNLGKGNFKEFRTALDDLGTYLVNARGKMSDMEMRNLGTSYIELDSMFKIFRKFENDGMYSNIFDKLRGSNYDLSTIRAALPNIYKAIIPVKGKKGAIEADVSLQKPGEGLLRNAIEQLAMLGKDGKLTRQAVASAVKQFKKDYPDFKDIDYSKVKSPAELLQMYSSYFGHLSNKVFGIGGTQPNGGLAKEANEFRYLFLNLIGKPDKKVPGIAQELKKANDFYRDTIVKTSMETQVGLRASLKGDIYQEPGNFIPKIIGSKTDELPTEFSTTTLENIGFMQKYVNDFFANTSPQDLKKLLRRKSAKQIEEGKYSLEKLKAGFNAIIGYRMNNITMTETGKTGTAQDVINYINAFDDPALEVLGLIKETGKRADGTPIYDLTNKQKLINDAISLQDLAQGDFINVKNLSVNTNFGKIMKQIFADDVPTTTNLEKLARVANKRPAQKRNIKAGLIQYIFSVDSGVFQQVGKNTAFSNAGDFTINSEALQRTVELVNSTPGFKAILNKRDFDILNGINQYMLTISKGMSDVGASLSGAQIIGGIIDGATNLEAGKFIKGLARLAGQNRLSKLFLSNSVMEMFTGASLKNIRTNKEKMKEIFLGKQSFAALVTNIALDPKAGLYEQTDEVLGTSQTLSQEEKDVLKQFKLN